MKPNNPDDIMYTCTFHTIYKKRKILIWSVIRDSGEKLVEKKKKKVVRLLDGKIIYYFLNLNYFSFGVFCAKLEPMLTKKLLKISAINFLSVIANPLNVGRFVEVLTFAFQVTVDLIASQVFQRSWNIFENSFVNNVF